MISNACIVGRSTLLRSTLLQGARVGDDSSVRACLVGKNATIGDGCDLNNVVIDHGSVVPDRTVLDGGQWPR